LNNIKIYKKIDSTQVKTKTLADKGAPQWTIIIAQEQTKGYGRLKREWSSNKGGLWFSFILKPKIDAGSIQKISFVASISLIRALKKQFGLKTKIKWVNDIFYKNKKIAGIIVESSLRQNKIDWLVIGIGVNINNDLPEELKNISRSIKDILGKKTDGRKLLSAFFNEFKTMYAKFLKSGFAVFADEYNKNLKFLNEEVKIENGKTIEGVNRGIDKEGRLVIESGKTLKKVVTGSCR
jgi:BirA family biotin operon repressor/biotin-[acetyl-CoA-carboxylase] ligase